MVWIGLILLAPALGSVDIYGDGEVRSEYLVQEQRQAGVVTPFAVFVRSLSSELRGDASSETVNLAAMPLVSVDAPSLKLGYGVHAEQTFWCKQGVLRTKELRDSYDEQIVADLAASILMDEPLSLSRERLDEAYETESQLHLDLNNRLAAYPADTLEGAQKHILCTYGNDRDGRPVSERITQDRQPLGRW